LGSGEIANLDLKASSLAALSSGGSVINYFDIHLHKTTNRLDAQVLAEFLTRQADVRPDA
jgi:hypothetical protein